MEDTHFLMRQEDVVYQSLFMHIHVAILLTRMEITFLNGQYLDRYIFDGHTKAKTKKSLQFKQFHNLSYQH